MKILNLIYSKKINVDIYTRMKVERNYVKIIKFIKGIFGKATDTSIYYPLVRSNRLYGDEFLLREYSGITQDLFALIEHGLYFGNNTNKIGSEEEWNIGCILTLGDYRKKLLAKVYPEYYCETIGPLIHYANEDEEFKNNVISKINEQEKTLLFFPVHGNEEIEPVYDTQSTLLKIIEIADRKRIYNIIVCVYSANIDLYEEVACRLGYKKRVVITSCGNRFDTSFLKKQKALINIADITMSNSLGTHVGYCVYLNKPHILLPQDFSYTGKEEALIKEFGAKTRSDNWNKDFSNEVLMFRELFNESIDYITEEQYRICDFYWGFSKIKSKDEIASIYNECVKYSRLFQKGLK